MAIDQSNGNPLNWSREDGMDVCGLLGKAKIFLRILSESESVGTNLEAGALTVIADQVLDDLKEVDRILDTLEGSD